LAYLALIAASATAAGTGTDALKNSNHMLTVQPNVLTVNEFVGSDNGPNLVFEFTVPAGPSLLGGGLPESLYDGSENDRSIIQMELPIAASTDNDEESGSRTSRVGVFSSPRYCWLNDQDCITQPNQGLWRAQLLKVGGERQWLQLATPLLVKEIGVYLPRGQQINPGDRIRLSAYGRVPAKATTWAQRPLVARLRYRSDPIGCTQEDGCWVTLDDTQVQPLNLTPLAEPAFIRVMAPLDVAAGESFAATIMITDTFGNPTPYTGPVRFVGDGTQVIQFAGTPRHNVQLQLQDPGFVRLKAQIAPTSVRSVPQYVKVSANMPARRRLVGDIHAHTGDGASQKKFIPSFKAGDHRALFTSTRESLFYMEAVAGYDFGAISEHSEREDSYALPPAVAADPAFEPGGACDGGKPPIGIGNWWPVSQRAAREYQATSNMIVFPAFEWHGPHNLIQHGDDSKLHRVVLYRDFDPNDALPIFPGDILGIAPQCLVRFLQLSGHGPDMALIIPHMSFDQPTNIDWDLSYQDEGPGAAIADRAQVESYHRVGEIFSARSYLSSQTGAGELAAFEGDDIDPGVWSFRHGWRNVGAHIGVIGASDDHSAMPGTDDTLAMDGSRMRLNDTSGTTFVLSETVDRDGVYNALHERASYASTGVRVWHNFKIDGSLMGSRISRSTPGVDALMRIASGGQLVTRVELWAARVGDASAPYQDLVGAQPMSELVNLSHSIPNPVAQGNADEEWLYYVRAFLASPHGDLTSPEDALWSSPIWITWSNP
jgi:hypothetical protein